jgi:uncharacterized protein YkwD
LIKVLSHYKLSYLQPQINKMRFTATVVALVFGYTALVSASPNLVEYVTVTKGNTDNYDSAPAYPADTPTTYQVSNEMPEADLYQMLCLVNQCRSAHGKKPLQLQRNLVDSAQVHSQYMAKINEMTHDDYRGGLGDRITASGFPNWSGVSENIASGQRSVDQVVKAWIKSPGHLANILGDTVYCGFGRVGNMWTQQFASPSSKNLYPQGSLEVCPSPGSKPVYASSSVEETQEYETEDHYVEPTYNNIVKYVTKTIGNEHYQAPAPVRYVTQIVQDTHEAPVKAYYTAEPVADVKAGCDE